MRRRRRNRKERWVCPCSHETHRVYVIEILRPGPAFMERGARPGQRLLYVGETSHDAACRLSQHLSGKADFGAGRPFKAMRRELGLAEGDPFPRDRVWLRRGLFPKPNDFASDDASKAAEQTHAKLLERRGYHVESH